METGQWTHRRVDVGRIELHVVEAGEGPLVVLLHGFPEFWYSWRHQIPALAAAGYRVVAPDLPGYGQSGRPRGVAAYRVGAVLDDLVGLIDAYGEERALLVGHDWGGALTWVAAAQRPDRIRAAAILNCPHPRVLLRDLPTPDQRRRSAYMFFFQLPWLPERTLRRGDFAAFTAMFRREPVRPKAFTDEDLRLYKDAFRPPGALTAALNYYRAAFRAPRHVLRLTAPTIQIPCHLIWGDRDRHLGINLSRGNEAHASKLVVTHVPEASHWIQADAPERVNELLLGFFAGLAGDARGGSPREGAA